MTWVRSQVEGGREEDGGRRERRGRGRGGGDRREGEGEGRREGSRRGPGGGSRPPARVGASCPRRTVAGLALDGDAWEVTEVVIAPCGRPPRELAPRWRTEPILRSTASRARPFTEFPSAGCSQGATLGASGLCGAWAPVCFLRQGNMSSTDPAGASRRSHAAPLPPPAAPVLTAVTLPHLPLKQVRAGGTHRARA